MITLRLKPWSASLHALPTTHMKPVFQVSHNHEFATILLQIITSKRGFPYLRVGTVFIASRFTLSIMPLENRTFHKQDLSNHNFTDHHRQLQRTLTDWHTLSPYHVTSTQLTLWNKDIISILQMRKLSLKQRVYIRSWWIMAYPFLCCHFTFNWTL